MIKRINLYGNQHLVSISNATNDNTNALKMSVVSGSSTGGSAVGEWQGLIVWAWSKELLKYMVLEWKEIFG